MSLPAWAKTLESDAVSGVVSAIGFLALTAAWQRTRRGVRDRTRSDAAPAGLDRSALRSHMAATIRRLGTRTGEVAICWAAGCLFHAVVALPGVPPLPDSIRQAIGIAEHATSALTCALLVSLYVELSNKGTGSRWEEVSLLSRPQAWLTIFGAVFTYECIARFTVPLANAGVGRPYLLFDLAYGLGLAVSLYLYMGRLDSESLNRHLRACAGPEQKLEPWLHRHGVLVGYGAASLQPIIALLPQELPWGIPAGLLLLDAAAKTWLILWANVLLREPDEWEKPGGFEAHAYETRRFASEDNSSFERSFLRRHFASEYTQRVRRRELGYLGIDYIYLDEFKLQQLGLSGLRGGMYVKRVVSGSHAGRAGLRPTDIVAAIRGMPIGLHNHLSDALAGTGPETDVDVEILRKRLPAKPATADSDYQRHSYTVRLDEYADLPRQRLLSGAYASLGGNILYNSCDHGVVCTLPEGPDPLVAITGVLSEAWGRYYETPDSRMLRVVMDQLAPGDVVTVFGRRRDSSTTHALTRLTLGQRTGLAGRHSADHPPISLVSITRTSIESWSKLLDANPHRFARRLVPEAPSPTPRLRCAACFDDEGSPLLEIYDEDGLPLHALLRSPIWSQIDSEEVHVFCGLPPSDSGEESSERLFRVGQFQTMKVRFTPTAGARGIGGR